MTNFIIQNIRIIDATQDFIGSIKIENQKISEIKQNSANFLENLENNINLVQNFQIIDGSNKIIMPGCFDPHVHFRDPGFTYKEDFETGSKAAISAGITSIFDMPNTNPPVFTVKNLNEKRNIADNKTFCNYGLFFGANINNLNEIKAAKNIPGIKLYLNTTTGNLKMDNEDKWREIFNLGKKIALHAEGETFFRAVEIWQEEDFPCELHLCHASLKSEVDLVRNIKKNPKSREKITLEVCPHHLFMTHEEREKHGAICCMKPELATQKDIDALWEGIEDNTVDFFATDHAPHTLAEKKESDRLGQAPVYGIPGVETFLPLLFTEFQKRNFSLQKLAKFTSYNVVNKYHVENKKAQIKTGFDADLIIIDPNIKSKISAKNLFSKSNWTPFEGREILMQLTHTFLAGELVFENNEFLVNKTQAQELIFKNCLNKKFTYNFCENLKFSRFFNK